MKTVTFKNIAILTNESGLQLIGTPTKGKKRYARTLKTRSEAHGMAKNITRIHKGVVKLSDLWIAI